MKLNKVKQDELNNDYTNVYNNTFSGKVDWSIICSKSPVMSNYETIRGKDDKIEPRKYGVVVEQVDLSIDHLEIMKTGFDYLVKEGYKIDNPIDFFNEYDKWFRSFNPSVTKKQDIQSSCDTLSPDIMKQYITEWTNYLTILLYPDRKNVSVKETSFEDLFGPVTSSIQE